MFDPHGIRRNKRRASRKGQIIQARAVPDPFVINPLHINAYKEFIIKNNIIKCPTPPEPQPKPKFTSPWYEVNEPNTYQLPPSATKLFALPLEGASVTKIYSIDNISESPITISNVGYYSDASGVAIDFDGISGHDFLADIIYQTTSNVTLDETDTPFITIPADWLLNSIEN